VAPVSQLDVTIASKGYPPIGQAPAHPALSNLQITLKASEFVCVLGPSGCGKTTLLNCIAGLDRDYDGEIVLPSVHGRARPVIGYVFQNPRLLPWRTVIENIELVLDPKQRDPGLVEELLEVTGLQPFRHAYPERLSLGLERRAALVRAFAVQPDVLLMDEPFVSLDEPTAQRLRALLLQVWQARPTTVVFVTHDLREAIQLADRLLLLSPAPGTLLADIEIGIARDRRADPAAVEAFRTRLIRENPLFHREF
jgi:NitT/TauT family transport system ATP-binding protein